MRPARALLRDTRRRRGVDRSRSPHASPATSAITSSAPKPRQRSDETCSTILPRPSQDHNTHNILAEISAFVLTVVAFGGAVAGCLGAMLGIGGGVFLIPFLNAIVGLPLHIAA